MTLPTTPQQYKTWTEIIFFWIFQLIVQIAYICRCQRRAWVQLLPFSWMLPSIESRSWQAPTLWCWLPTQLHADRAFFHNISSFVLLLCSPSSNCCIILARTANSHRCDFRVLRICHVHQLWPKFWSIFCAKQQQKCNQNCNKFKNVIVGSL